MDIVIRNLFSLLRSATYGVEEPIEPMSAWKWGRAYHLAMVHGVEAETWKGIQMSQDQFFMHLTTQLREQWEQSASHATLDDSSDIPSRLDKQLRDMADGSAGVLPASAAATMNVMRAVVALSQCLLTGDRWVRRLMLLGAMLTSGTQRIDRDLLEEWIDELDMERMVQLEEALLTQLMGINEDRLPLPLTLDDKQRRMMTEEVVATIEATNHQWEFSQGNNIFVRNSSSAAMYWQARHSVRYLKYHPKESISSFFSSFVQSLTNIEE